METILIIKSKTAASGCTRNLAVPAGGAQRGNPFASSSDHYFEINSFYVRL